MRYFILDGTTPIAIEPVRCRCGSTEVVDVPLHDGQSLSRDCKKCGKFIYFLRWYGKESPRPTRYHVVTAAGLGPELFEKIAPDLVSSITKEDAESRAAGIAETEF